MSIMAYIYVSLEAFLAHRMISELIFFLGSHYVLDPLC